MTTHNFEAETGRILELLTHSIYSNKEIFLRELISNAADAVGKARLKSLTDVNFLGDDTEFKITVETDKEKGIITITDNGIGMTKEELISHLGTIAKSGTKEFLEKLQKAKEDGEHNLIGQFGVGFYSSFMVADKVEVKSKSALDKKAHKWTSDGKTGFDIEEIDERMLEDMKSKKERVINNVAENEDDANISSEIIGKKSSANHSLYRGTKITLYINEANKELLEEWKLKDLIKKYSNYVQVPIMMRKYDNRTEEEKKKESKVMDFEQVNETKPIWKKNKKDIKPEEYKEFYQNLVYDWNDPLFVIHNNVEGMVSYKSILFAPKEANLYKNLADPNLEYGPKLYVQNVMILENAKELIPVWLRFVSGVVETNDLPLNISREMLQSNSSLDKIKKGLTKKVLSEFGKILKDNREDYAKFWLNYGKVLKEGIHYEWELKEEVAEVSLWNSLNKGGLISLEEYLSKLKAENGKLREKGKHEDGEKFECGKKQYIGLIIPAGLDDPDYIKNFKNIYVDDKNAKNDLNDSETWSLNYILTDEDGIKDLQNHMSSKFRMDFENIDNAKDSIVVLGDFIFNKYDDEKGRKEAVELAKRAGMDEKYVKLLDEEHSKSFNKEEKSDIRQKYEEYYEGLSEGEKQKISNSKECKDGECCCEHNYDEKCDDGYSKDSETNSEGQGKYSGKTIYYIISKSENEAKASPYIAQFKEKGIDVLILTDAIDSFLVQSLTEFKGAKFVSITSGDIELETENGKLKAERERKSKDLKPLLDLIKFSIGEEKIEEVVLNDKLGNALGALKTPKNGMDPQLEKMMRAMGQSIPIQKRILELNPKNSLVDLMKKEFDKDIKSEKLQDVIKYVYGQAVLLEGGELDNIGEFVEVMNKIAVEGMS